jgi:hypothetical protein
LKHLLTSALFLFASQAFAGQTSGGSEGGVGLGVQGSIISGGGGAQYQGGQIGGGGGGGFPVQGGSMGGGGLGLQGGSSGGVSSLCLDGGTVGGSTGITELMLVITGILGGGGTPPQCSAAE